jgi:apolipoprotein D and lipocalin family protein
MRICIVLFILILGASIMIASEKGKSVPVVVPSVDLNRYAGKWYEIARYPNRFQKICDCDVTAEYSILKDGKIEVLNQCRKATGEISAAKGKAKIANKKGPNTKLKVRFAPAYLSFLPMVWGDYWILELSPDYSYAAVGAPNREYLWILSRTPTLDEGIYQELLKKLSAQGFDPSRLVKTKQAK